MKRLNLILSSLALLILIACGGGGGGAPITTINVFGRLLKVTDGKGLTGATIQIGGGSTLVSASDGSFSLPALSSGGTVIVNSGVPGITGWTFTLPASSVDVDLGDLYVGPEKVVVTGKIVDSANGNPVSGATVRFAGRIGTTNSSGIYSLADVAFSSTSTATFLNIPGTANATNYFQGTFTPSGGSVSGTTVTLSDVALIPQGGTTPPPTPYTLYGRLTPTASANGATVEVFSGTTKIRTYLVGTDGMFYFWVPSGTYRLTFKNGSLTAPDANVNLPADTVLRQDATLN